MRYLLYSALLMAGLTALILGLFSASEFSVLISISCFLGALVLKEAPYWTVKR